MGFATLNPSYASPVLLRLGLRPCPLAAVLGFELGLAPGGALAGSGVPVAGSLHLCARLYRANKRLGRDGLTPCSLIGSPGRIRTIDPAVNSRLLYH